VSAKETLDRFRELRHSGRLDEALELVHPDMVLHEAESLPYGGEYHGPDGFRKLFDVVYGLFEVTATVETHDAGTFCCAIAHCTFTSRQTGRSTDLPIVENYYVENGLITRVDIYYKDTAAVLALLD
jgi:uncharacterized protein